MVTYLLITSWFIQWAELDTFNLHPDIPNAAVDFQYTEYGFV